MSGSGYVFLAQTSKPYNSCWDWNTFKGTAFAARASAWMPVMPNDQNLRCLPDKFPAETQMFNLPSPCPEQQCSNCKSGQSCSGNVSIANEGCPSCRKTFMSILNGYAPNGIIDTHNPLL